MLVFCYGTIIIILSYLQIISPSNGLKWNSCLILGGHLNPAVTLAMALLGRIKFGKVPIYMLAQYMGAFVASAIVYGIYLGNTFLSFRQFAFK